MRKIRFPSPAMVVSLVALFVALGGAGYAAVTLPRASVGSAQIRSGAVTETKIANGAVPELHDPDQRDLESQGQEQFVDR